MNILTKHLSTLTHAKRASTDTPDSLCIYVIACEDRERLAAGREAGNHVKL